MTCHPTGLHDGHPQVPATITQRPPALPRRQGLAQWDLSTGAPEPPRAWLKCQGRHWEGGQGSPQRRNRGGRDPQPHQRGQKAAVRPPVPRPPERQQQPGQSPTSKYRVTRRSPPSPRRQPRSQPTRDTNLPPPPTAPVPTCSGDSHSATCRRLRARPAIPAVLLLLLLHLLLLLPPPPSLPTTPPLCPANCSTVPARWGALPRQRITEQRGGGTSQVPPPLPRAGRASGGGGSSSRARRRAAAVRDHPPAFT